MSFNALMIAWPEPFKTMNRAASVVISPTNHFHQIVYRDCDSRLCVDMSLRVCTHNVMMDELVFDGWAALSGCCGLGLVIKGSDLLLSV